MRSALVRSPGYELVAVINMIDFVEACHEIIGNETKSIVFRDVFGRVQRDHYCIDSYKI